MTDPALPPGMSPTGTSHPSGQGSPSAPAEPPAAAVKRRQVLLLAGIAGTIVAGTLLSVSLTGTKGNDAQPAKPQSTNILAPGAQVDPRDAWRGQADAQLKAIEQRSRDLAQRNAELEGQGKEMLERLKKLEGSGLTPLPPPPVTAPAARPSFGPDRPGSALPDAGPQRFAPPPPPMPQGALLIDVGENAPDLSPLATLPSQIAETLRACLSFAATDRPRNARDVLATIAVC